MVREYDVLSLLNMSKNVKEEIEKVVKEEWFESYLKREGEFDFDASYLILTILQLEPRLKGSLIGFAEKIDFKGVLGRFESEQSAFTKHCYIELFTYAIINLDLVFDVKLKLIDTAIEYLKTPNKLGKGFEVI